MSLDCKSVEIPLANEITSLDDLRQLDELQKSVMLLHSELYVPLDPERYSAVSYFRCLADRYEPGSHNLAVVTSQSGKLAAAVNFSLGGALLNIDKLIVAEQYRRNPNLRVGSFVMQTIIAAGKQAGAKTIELHSNLEYAAENFYANIGFIKTDATRRELSIS